MDAVFTAEDDVDYRQILTIDPKKRSGKPCIRGTRMTVYDVLEYLAAGMTHAEILDDFPNLTEDDIRACLAFAADMGKRVGVIQTLAPRRCHEDSVRPDPVTLHRDGSDVAPSPV